MKDTSSQFSSFAAFYARSTELTGGLAQYGISQMPPITKDSVVHDNAAGPAVAALIIAEQYENDATAMPLIHATDLAEGMIQAAQKQVEDKGLGERIKTAVMDSKTLGFEDETFTHSIMNFAIMMPEPETAVKEIHRTLKPGGVVMVTTWKQSASYIMDLVSDTIRPDKENFAPYSNEWLKKEKLIDTLVAGGFKEEDIAVTLKENYAEFADWDDMRGYFTHPFWGMWRRGWTEEESAKWDGTVEVVLKEQLGGETRLKGIAWVAVAKK